MREGLGAPPVVGQPPRHARRVATATLAFAAAVIVGLAVFDLAGRLPLPPAVAGHEGSSVAVGPNGLRLLRRRHRIP